VPALVVIGRAAIASGEFLPDDVPGTSGRLDVLLRCIRAALLCSHGVREDVTIYLVLGGGPRAPRSLRIDGATVRFIRPDERSLATLARKVLASRVDETAQGFAEVREGIALARGGLEVVLADLGAGAALFVLDEAGADIRESSAVEEPGAVFVLGDHLGFDDGSRAVLAERGARAIGVGPRSLHAEDVIAIVLNEVDRRTTKPGG
jgi:tRNA (pseudouridine54-N1)-methyltransferase